MEKESEAAGENECVRPDGENEERGIIALRSVFATAPVFWRDDFFDISGEVNSGNHHANPDNPGGGPKVEQGVVSHRSKIQHRATGAINNRGPVMSFPVNLLWHALRDASSGTMQPGVSFRYTPLNPGLAIFEPIRVTGIPWTSSVTIADSQEPKNQNRF
jgi:hypothetical protein